jgi:beta-glucosidase-like glycosyl hydrolase
MKFTICTLLSVTAVCTAFPHSNPTLNAATHVIYSYPEAHPPADLLTLITAGKVGGVILFGQNVNANLSTDIATMQQAWAASPAYDGLPLMIQTDQEGRYVRRLPGGPYLSEKQVGESADPVAAATTAGQQAAAALNAVGVNVNLAPVLGVYRQTGDFLDQWQRSYGNTSAVVAECAKAFIPAQQKQGDIATAKHWPGLGAATASANTDAEPVTITLSLETLRTVDEVPFAAAIEAGVDMVMASWAVYPALDDKPSGLSEKWIKGELRGRLGFRGVTITDAIEAGALVNYGDDANRGVLATQAGMDLILASARNVTQGEVIVDALAQALENGDVDRGEFNAATARILALRRGLKHGRVQKGP